MLFGTSGLIPPESEKEGKNVSTYPHDIYSFGATIYRMLTFEIPFEEDGKRYYTKGINFYKSKPTIFIVDLLF